LLGISKIIIERLKKTALTQSAILTSLFSEKVQSKWNGALWKLKIVKRC